MEMPQEIKDADEFLKLAEKAEVCRVKRRGEEVKLKLRGKSRLYTLLITSSEAAELIKKIKCDVVEL